MIEFRTIASPISKTMSSSFRSRRLLTSILSLFAILAISISLGMFATLARAAIDVYEFDTPQQEAQYRGLIAEFRCPKCQNQSLAGSDSQISQDLKRKTYKLVMEGQTDSQIRDYMYERYGDFISYKPPIRPSTWILWFLPPLLLLVLISWWLWRNAKAGRGITKAIDVSSSVQSNLAASANSSFHLIQEKRDNIEDTASSKQVQSGLTTDEATRLQSLLNKHSTETPHLIDEDDQ